MLKLEGILVLGYSELFHVTSTSSFIVPLQQGESCSNSFLMSVRKQLKIFEASVQVRHLRTSFMLANPRILLRMFCSCFKFSYYRYQLDVVKVVLGCDASTRVVIFR